MTDETQSPAPSVPTGLSLLIQPLARTQPWVRFLAIMGFVAAAFMLLIGVFAGLAGLATGRVQTFAFMLVYPIFAVVYVFPSLYLLRYADGIRSFVATGQDQDLAGALDAQRSFWKFAGIFTIVSIIFGIAMAAFGIVAGILFGLGGRQFGV